MSDRTRKFTSAGQRKPPSKAGLPPKLAQGATSAKPGAFGLHLIAVKRRQPCAECAIEITPRERAVHYRDDGTLYHLHCMSLRMLRAAAGRPADERKLLIEKICHHLYEVETPDALPPEVRASVRALRDSQA